MSKQLKKFYKHSYGRGIIEENNIKFGFIAGESNGDVSSEVSLDEIRVEDNESAIKSNLTASQVSSEDLS